MGYNLIRELGAFIIWMSKGFKGKYSNIRDNYKYSFYLGFIVAVLLGYLTYQLFEK